MDFRTPVSLNHLPYQFGLAHRFLAVGSCFADHIGNKLAINKFKVSNPFGTIFNPISVCTLLLQSCPNPNRFVQNADLWHHLDYHSDYWAFSKEELNDKLRQSFCKEELSHTDVLLFTFGTAWVYEWQIDGEPVANCHKLPTSRFTKRLLDIQEIVTAVKLILESYPNLHLILSVSPVRHTKDTLQGNAVSKSILRLACHDLEKHERVTYFPAYEILLDDLRDYRFYEADLLHPNQQAITYIWEVFTNYFLDAEARKWLTKWQSIYRSLQHRPLYPGSANHVTFMNKLLDELKNIEEVDVSSEISYVESLLAT